MAVVVRLDSELVGWLAGWLVVLASRSMIVWGHNSVAGREGKFNGWIEFRASRSSSGISDAQRRANERQRDLDESWMVEDNDKNDLRSIE